MTDDTPNATTRRGFLRGTAAVAGAGLAAASAARADASLRLACGGTLCAFVPKGEKKDARTRRASRC